MSPLRKDRVTGAGWIDVAFANVPGGLRVGGEPQGFVLLDAEGRVVPAIFKVTLRDATARLHVLPEYLAAGLRLSYGHGNTPVCNLVDARDCATPVFGPIPVRAELRPL